MDVAYARLCLPYLASVALMGGEVGLGDFSDGRLNDPVILDLADKISVVEDGGVDPAAFTPLRAAAQLKDGRTVQAIIAVMPGGPDHPLTQAEHMEKARRCLAYAGLEAAHAALADRIGGLETERDVADALRF
jgi:2-methylcitrate dehydratase PrpD